jgi:dihydrofolate reductase
MSQKTTLAMIVAAAENDVIGNNEDLPWRLSADLKRFKALTMGHHIIMGRKTFDSIGRLLPGRTTVIVTRNADFKFEGAKIAHSVDAAIHACRADQVAFLTGGAEIYRQALPQVDELYLTRVHAKVEGDTTLPDIDWDQWELVSEERHAADEKNEHAFSFLLYRRVTH